MSLIYRALWQDTGLHDACSTAQETFASWVAQKWPMLEVPAEGQRSSRGRRHGDIAELEVTVSAGGDANVGIPSAYRADLVETWSSGTRWHTTLRAWHNQDTSSTGTTEKWIWTDVEVVGDDISRIATAAPGLVNELLAKGVSPSVDGDALLTAPAAVNGFSEGEALAEVISRQDRTVPLIVINDHSASRARAAQSNLYFPDVAEAIHRAAAGIAVVYVVDNGAADGIIAGLGRTHGLWDGAMRVYLADVDPAAPNNEWRHRYFTADRYAGSKAVARRSIGRILGRLFADLLRVTQPSNDCWTAAIPTATSTRYSSSPMINCVKQIQLRLSYVNRSRPAMNQMRVSRSTSQLQRKIRLCCAIGSKSLNGT